jgi:hypothetical protein
VSAEPQPAEAQPATPNTPWDLAQEHPYLAGGAALGALGLGAAGAMAARRALGMRNAYVSRYNAIPHADPKNLLRNLKPGDIIVNSVPTSQMPMKPGMGLLQRLHRRAQAVAQDVVQGDARHALIYVGNGHVVHMIPDENLILDHAKLHLNPGTSVLRPNLPETERAAAARRAVEALRTPMDYDWKNMRRIALNRFMPISCTPGTERTCSSIVADVYGDKTLVPSMSSRAVAPADLVATDRVTPLGRVPRDAPKVAAYQYSAGARAASSQFLEVNRG